MRVADEVLYDGCMASCIAASGTTLKAEAHAKTQSRKEAVLAARAGILVLFCIVLQGAAIADDRDAARWVIRNSGRVRLAGQSQIIATLDALPEGTVQLEAVDLIGTTIDPAEFPKLAGATGLRELLLPGPSFNPGAGSKLDANDEFKVLAGLTKLEKLHFSLHFLTNINVQDKGLAYLKTLTGLKELRAAQSRLKGSSLAPFVNLEKLDLNYSTFGDDGMEYLIGLKKLKVLELRDTLVTDRGAPHLGHLPALEELDLYGAKLTDSGIRSLSPAKKLRRLNLLGSQVTDEGVETLAGLPMLEELILYRSQISNTGLARLAQLKNLKELDLRYTRVSRGGVDAFRKANPQCKVLFQDATPQTGSAELRESKPANATVQAIAEWVRKMGGRAEFAEGSLREIDLARTPVTDAQLKHLASLPALKKLSLESTEAGDLGMASIARLATLEQLNLSYTLVTDKGLTAIGGLSALRRLTLNGVQASATGLVAYPELEDLELAGSALDDKGLLKVCSIPSLRSVRLGYSNLTDEGIGCLSQLSNLRSLDLTSVDLTDAGMPHIGKLSSLEELNISYGRFTDKGLKHLVALKQLRRLEMMKTRFSDVSAETIAQLTGLRRLNLDYTNLSGKGLAILAGALVSLEELRLDTANLDDTAAAVLGAMPKLKYVNVYHTMITDKGHEALRKLRPDLQVIYDRDSSLPNRRKS